MDVGMGEKEALVLPGFGNLTIFCKMVNKKSCFLSFEWEKWNFTTFSTFLEKSFWLLLEKSAIAPPGKNPSDTHAAKSETLTIEIENGFKT